MQSKFLRPLWALALCLPSLALAQGDPSTVAKIIEEGKNHSQVMKTLRQLCDIGPRLTSSTNLDRARKWAMEKFKSYGCVNVHEEKWGEWPVGFDRGKRQLGRMVEPFDSEFVFTTPSWSEGTHGLVRGQAVLPPKTMDEFNSQKSMLKGKWIVMPDGRPGRPKEEDKPLWDAIAASGCAGMIFSSNSELVITFGNYRDKTYENHPKDVSVIVRKSDMDRIVRNIEYGRRVTLEFDLENNWVKGPRSNYNVVAEIKGTEKPDEVVIVSGHLDSWDGPGSQGALDNGTGSCTAIEAARILTAVGAKPKRTIRFILWTGEEQGLFGSNKYVEDHAAELDKISCVLVDDGGTNYQGGYMGLESMRPMFEMAFAPVNAAFPDLPEVFKVVGAMPKGGGSDHVPFNAKGVPGFFTMETGRSDYGYVHHTQHDRYEMAIPEYLVQSATNHAVVSYNLACADSLMPRAPEQ